MDKVKLIEIFKDSHLPKEGWLQACFNCYSITSKTFIYKVVVCNNEKYKFSLYCCPSCKNKLKDNFKYYKFSKLLDKYIYCNYDI